MNERANTTLRTDQVVLDQLDKYADKMGLSRNQLINNLLTIGLDDLKTLDRMGLIRLGYGLRTMIEKLREPSGEMQPTT